MECDRRTVAVLQDEKEQQCTAVIAVVRTRVPVCEFFTQEQQIVTQKQQIVAATGSGAPLHPIFVAGNPYSSGGDRRARLLARRRRGRITDDSIQYRAEMRDVLLPAVFTAGSDRSFFRS